MELISEKLTINDVLDRLRDKHGSLYAAADHMGIRLQVLSNYDKGRSLPDDVMAIRLADELGIPRGQMLAMVAAERAERQRNPEAATVWRELAEKMGVMSVAAIVALALVQIAQPGDAGNLWTISALSNALAFDTRYTLYAAAAILLLWCASAHSARHQGENNDNARPVA